MANVIPDSGCNALVSFVGFHENTGSLHGESHVNRETLAANPRPVDLGFNLQFFADEEKTEDATPRKKEEARKKGQVPRSAELSTIITLLAAFVILRFLGDFILKQWLGYMQVSFSPDILNIDLGQDEGSHLFRWHLMTFLKVFLPTGFGCMVVGVLVNLMQTRGLFSLEPLKPKWDRINPLQGFKRLFSPRSLVELVKSLFKLGIVGYILWNSLRNELFPLSQRSVDMASTVVISSYWSLLHSISIRIIAALLLLAVLDYVYQRWEHKRSLKMTKKELKDEYKQTEGDPLIKSKIRQRQKQMAMRRMMQDVPKADVIITNPTHYAVALGYDGGTMGAPQVLAKGEGFIAARIREIASENGVPLVENPPLARAIYKAVDVGEFIPAHLYQAVAEVLAFVYKLRKKKV